MNLGTSYERGHKMKRTTLLAGVLSIAMVLFAANPAFAMRDMVGYRDGMGLYQYVQSAPAAYVDPMGLQAAAPAPPPATYTPRFRRCCLFERGMVKGPVDVGSHGQDMDGIVFTCRCGWLDTGHIRQSMDVFLKMYQAMAAAPKKGTAVVGLEEVPLLGPIFSFKLAKDVPAANVSSVAASMAYDEGLLHEIMSAGIMGSGMFNSAFSPEDLPSNITGIYLAQANIGKMKKTGDWPGLMDAAIQAVLKECEALPKDKGLEVWDQNIKNKWVSGEGIDVTLLNRNMSNEPWNVACKQCDHVKDKTVPKWLAAGIALDRAMYDTVSGAWKNAPASGDIDGKVKLLRDAFEKQFGKPHLIP